MTIGLGKSAGKTFVVGKTGLPYSSFYRQLIRNDNDGVVRYTNTIAAAALLCTANGSDQIIVLPGHTETVSSSTAFTISTASVRITGLGMGTDRPTITLDTATTTTLNITANNVAFSNMIFIANFAAIASLFTLTTAKEFTLTSCEFRDTSNVLNFVAIVTTNSTSNAADGLTMNLCKRIGAGADTNTTIVSMVGTNDRLTVTNNYFAHNAVTAAGLMIIATGKIVTNADIDSNLCNFVGATGTTTGILITTNGTTNSGVLRRNFIKSLDVTTEILVTASSGFIYFNNYYAGAADASGYLLPAADA